MFWQLNIKNKKGRIAEKIALSYLSKKQLKLIKKNYATKVGEIDLIMIENTTLVFLEVRYRKNNQHNNIGETITTTKKNKMTLTANHFLQSHKSYQNYHCRFDAVLIQPNFKKIKNTDLSIQWLKGIF